MCLCAYACVCVCVVVVVVWILNAASLRCRQVERCWFPDALLTHVYLATAKAQPLDKRLFVRTIVLRQPARTEDEGMAALLQLANSELPTAFNTLEQAIGDSRYSRTETNHIFFRLLSPVAITRAKLEQAIASLLPPHSALIKQVSTGFYDPCVNDLLRSANHGLNRWPRTSSSSSCLPGSPARRTWSRATPV